METIDSKTVSTDNGDFNSSSAHVQTVKYFIRAGINYVSIMMTSCRNSKVIRQRIALDLILHSVHTPTPSYK